MPLLPLLKTLCSTKRLCPLFGIALMFGCGKKINDVQNTAPAGSTNQNQLLPSSLTLKLIESQGLKSVFSLPRDGIFELPMQLVVQQGDSAFKNVKISYNIEPGGEYEFHCLYRSTGQTKIIPLYRCEDPTGGSFGDISGREFAMDQDKKIEMVLTNPTSNDLIIDANFLVRWF